MKISLKKFAETSLLLLSLTFLASSSFAATYYVGTCHSGSYTTISAAVSAVPANSIVDVCPGTYIEQVFINQPLTLQGIKSGLANRVRIVPPLDIGGVIPWTTVPNPIPGELPIAPQIFVSAAAGNVKLIDLTTDASAATAKEPVCSTAKHVITGIAYLDSSGTILGDSTIGEGESSGCSVGILAVASTSNTVSMTITNNSVQNENLAGIKLEASQGNAGLNATVTRNSVVVGPGTLSSDTGIQVFGVSGSIELNDIGTVMGGGIVFGILETPENDVGPLTISNNSFYGGPGSGLVGIRMSTPATARTLSGNRMVGLFEGFWLLPSGGGTLMMQSNEISNGGLGIDFGCTVPILSGNTINNSGVGVYKAHGGIVPSGVTLYNISQRNGGGPC